MYKVIDLSGVWKFQLDEEKKDISKQAFADTITLPDTTSHAKKGKKNDSVETGFLTDEYKFEGYAWFSKTIEISEEVLDKNYFLYLERTRVTTLWIDGIKVGTQNSLATPHVYDVTNYLSLGEHKITILVDNTNYPTKGGHLTSPDTQTNWNGITGRIELQIFNKAYLDDVQVYPDVKNKLVTIKAHVVGADKGVISVLAQSFNSNVNHKTDEKQFEFDSKDISISYPLGENALLWSEYEPNLYKLNLDLIIEGLTIDTNEVTFGLREFKAEGDKFTINGVKTFLRGKHDGLIFPMTGFAPTSVEEWLKILKTSKSYGINHYRFHTCCPPEAAFTAADILGVYMQPELPFWGTVTDENDENHNPKEQEYLINQGFSMLKSYGNHPSFVAMSMGNELWGSKERLNEMLKGFKTFDNRHLYTEGSNNFQFCPVILENDDFFSGVRFSRNRLIRGSYAMCDAPLGHVQTAEPSTMKSYDEAICPKSSQNNENSALNSDGTIEIQYGTGTKKVKAADTEELIPNVPVVSHEIGQYATYPNFEEIKKYTGSIKARNFEVFKEHLEKKGLGDLAKKYFECSGKLAVACYKEEMEAVFRSKKLAGFQLLDLQDFSGQGTALVGVLDAFMESKGLISPEEWRSFCSDAVLMAKFAKYNYEAEESFNAEIELSYYKNIPLDNFKVSWKLKDNNKVYETREILVQNTKNDNYISIGSIDLKMPGTCAVKKLTLSLEIEETDIKKTYDLWVYPKATEINKAGLNIFDSLSEQAVKLLEKGEKVVIFPKLDNLKNSVEGFYCTDFWCYPMFRSISESMNKEVPVGTMGLLINNSHPVFKDFPCEEYSTYQWWNIVSNSRSIIMDDTIKEFRPIVQTIDNFERNHKLGLLFEAKVLSGSLLVCACDFEKVMDKVEVKQFLSSILNYVGSSEFKPQVEVSVSDMKKLFK